jgi:transposase
VPEERLLLPECLDDYVDEENLVRVMDVFVDELDLATLGFAGPAATGRPGHSPATMLKLYLYGYLNQVQSSRRLEREAGRNVECMWLTGTQRPAARSDRRSYAAPCPPADRPRRRCYCRAPQQAAAAA